MAFNDTVWYHAPITSGMGLSIEMIPVSTVSADDATAARRKAFVDAAREGFFANGYAGTTMSSIASTVGGSKTTLWSYFPSKEALFEAVVRSEEHTSELQSLMRISYDVLCLKQK